MYSCALLAGISLGPLGALLAQRRRVVIPDLLEFEFGCVCSCDYPVLTFNGIHVQVELRTRRPATVLERFCSRSCGLY